LAPKRIFPLRGRGARLRGRDAAADAAPQRNPASWELLEGMRLGSRSPGLRQRKVTAGFALSGNFLAPRGAKVAASRAERKRGGRGVEVRRGEER